MTICTSHHISTEQQQPVSIHASHVPLTSLDLTLKSRCIYWTTHAESPFRCRIGILNSVSPKPNLDSLLQTYSQPPSLHLSRCRCHDSRCSGLGALFDSFFSHPTCNLQHVHQQILFNICSIFKIDRGIPSHPFHSYHPGSSHHHLLPGPLLHLLTGLPAFLSPCPAKICSPQPEGSY